MNKSDSSRLQAIDYRHTCTKDDPWTREKSFYGDHPDAECLTECDADGAGVFHCPHCDRVFREWPDKDNWTMLCHRP